MQPVVGQHAFHAADAERASTLPELLGDDRRRCLGIEEAVPDHLPDDLRGSTVVAFRAAFLTVQRQRAPLAKRGAKLKIALLAVAELLCSLKGS